MRNGKQSIWATVLLAVVACTSIIVEETSEPVAIEAGQCSFTGSSPASSDDWWHGDSVTVLWTSDCPCDVLILISIDGGTVWDYLADAIPNTGSHEVEVPLHLFSDNTKIRVICTDGSVYGDSDGLFSIWPPTPTSALTIPNMASADCGAGCST